MSIMRSNLKVLGALALLPACTVENNGSIAIVANGTADTTGGTCQFEAEPEFFRSSGILDVTLGHGYLMGLVVENRMRDTTLQRQPTTGTDIDTTAERNQVTLRAFDVEMEALCDETTADCAAVASVVNTAVRVPAAGTVPPGGTITVATGVIPSSVAVGLVASGGLNPFPGPSVRLGIRAVGGRNPDEEMESGTFEYVVDLCEGCLVRGLNPPRDCPGGQAPGYCGLAQDRLIDCCFSGSELFCPASTAPATP
jgi:hypothetical protein